MTDEQATRPDLYALPGVVVPTDSETHHLGGPVHCVARIDGKGYVPGAMTAVQGDRGFVLFSNVEGAWTPLADIYPA